MLLELLVENYAVIERLRVRFHRGLNVLTGETGSGKSIVVDALGLLLGGRASVEMLRSGSDRARISGIFEAPRALIDLLRESAIEAEDGELLVEREILANGKSRAFIASRPVTAALLREVAPHLGDIHGQHEQQELFGRSAQRRILDTFGGLDELRSQVAERFRAWRRCTAELEELERTEQEKLRLLDIWAFQRNELESAALRIGEDEDLESERRVLQNVGKLLDNANTAYAALYDAPQSAYAQLRTAQKRLEDLCRIDESMGGALEILKPAEIAVNEAAASLRDYLGRLESDPARLEDVESRLAALSKLKRKYGNTVQDMLGFLESVRTQIAAAESSADRRVQLEKDNRRLSSEFEKTAGSLTQKRRDAASRLAGKVKEELRALAMDRTAFEVRVSPESWSEAGADAVDFLVSANVGEELRPLERVVSGGELSRIALALKVSSNDQPGFQRTLVFDEVDAGIGGGAADAVGKRLKRISDNNQVLCVTHLAQIAGYGDHHYAVSKQEVKGRTVAAIEELVGDVRTREIGRMLSGQRLTPEALKHAEQLIRSGGE